MIQHCYKLAIAILALAALPFAQTTSSGQDYNFAISTSQEWTDTGLDLQSGEILQISTGTPASAVPDRHAVPAAGCDPKGDSGNSSDASGLPLPSAPQGVLIARLHSQGAMPMLVGAGTELHIEEASHLYLGVNISGAPVCQGTFAVRIHRTTAEAVAPNSQAATPEAQSLTTTPATVSAQPAAKTATPSSGSTATGTTEAQPKSRNEQLRSQLSSAAQIFMSGQFGTGKSDTNAASNAASDTSSNPSTPAPVLKLSDAALDSSLRHSIDGFPRRINDQFNNLGDMVNFVIVGSEKDVQAVLDSANWHIADTDNRRAVLNAVLETYQNKDYLQMPMSTLYLFGRKQDFGYEQAEPIAMVASRHHFRIWKTTATWQGHEIWVGAGTHDIGFAKDKRNNSVTHKIDPAVDGERDNIGSSLQKTGKIKSLTYYLPPDPVQDAKNATGDGYHSDGRMLVIQLQ